MTHTGWPLRFTSLGLRLLGRMQGSIWLNHQSQQTRTKFSFDFKRKREIRRMTNCIYVNYHLKDVLFRRQSEWFASNVESYRWIRRNSWAVHLLIITNIQPFGNLQSMSIRKLWRCNLFQQVAPRSSNETVPQSSDIHWNTLWRQQNFRPPPLTCLISNDNYVNKLYGIFFA